MMTTTTVMMMVVNDLGEVVAAVAKGMLMVRLRRLIAKKATTQAIKAPVVKILIHLLPPETSVLLLSETPVLLLPKTATILVQKVIS
jgi:hypothetical protein